MPNVAAISESFPRSRWRYERYDASAMIVVTFTNSEGWSPNPPMPNQLFVPATVLPATRTAISRRIDMA